MGQALWGGGSGIRALTAIAVEQGGGGGMLGTRRGQSEGPKGRGGDIPVCAQIVVTVWQRDSEPAELQEGGGFGGYLGLLQGRAPSHVFRQEQGAFKAQGVNSPPPPSPPLLSFCHLKHPPGSPLSP